MSGNFYSDFVGAIGSRLVTNEKDQYHHLGYWGRPSATVDWCEPNYVFSHYIAEMWNTLSSFAMVFVGLVGVYLHFKEFERRISLTFWSVVIVGIGSAAFHGTLLFSLQMLDELPMIYSALIMSYCIIEHENIKPRFKWLPSVLALHAIITTLLVASPALAPEYSSPMLQFVCFHLSFAALEIFLIGNVIGMYRKERNPEIRSVYQTGLLLWVTGIAFWLIDYLGCELLWEGVDSIRMRYLTWNVPVPDVLSWWLIGGRLVWTDLPIGVPNLQLHSWWHICASSGLYWLSCVVAKNRAEVLGNKTSIKYFLRVIPYAYIVKKAKASTEPREYVEQSTPTSRKESGRSRTENIGDTPLVKNISSSATKRQKLNLRSGSGKAI